MEARPHPKQAERLRALQSYEILDTDREQDFDEVVQLCAALCEAPISVINLIDADRQWFKAEIGLGVRETPLATSLCSHVILEDDFVEIHDTLEDPRMQDNPLCCGKPGLRFYAGALLRSDDGLPIGTLCVLDTRPRTLTPLQRDAILVLARQVMAQLNLRRALRRADVLRKEVDHRVKNSLASLTALLRLQMQHTSAPEGREALAALRPRLETMVLLHDLLQRTDLGARFDLGAYVEDLGRHLQEVAPDNVALELQTTNVPVSSEEASSIGILVNEFATNSFRHAFPDHRPGRVRFALSREEQDVVLSCSDDGVGFTRNGSGGLGMMILEAVSSSLGGSFNLSPGPGGVHLRLAFHPAEL